MARTDARPRSARVRHAPSLRIVWTSLPPRRAAAVARALVIARVAACVQVVPGVRSVYRWAGAIRADREALLIVKTTRGSLPRCLSTLARVHPYEVPEVVVLSPGAVSEAYDAWARGETRGETRGGRA
jgi:periplasmic divalent cation tolerance protein